MEPSGFFNGLKRFILWDLPRSSWQYEVMVTLILAFIFLTPKEVFRDQPKPKDVVLVTQEHGSSVYWVEPDALPSGADTSQSQAFEKLVRSQAGSRSKTVYKVEAIFDNEKILRGYTVSTKP